MLQKSLLSLISTCAVVLYENPTKTYEVATLIKDFMDENPHKSRGFSYYAYQVAYYMYSEIDLEIEVTSEDVSNSIKVALELFKELIKLS